MDISINIPNRMNWIDWAKSLAIAFVVFGHIPADPNCFTHNYITSFHMPLFFFISGYLTKKEYMCKSTLVKYWQTLIIPYLCYNVIFYPYWVIRFTIDHPSTTWFDFVKPILGALMLQIKLPYTDYLNGVTWFVSSLLVMKIILSVCNKYRAGIFIISFLGIASALFYIVNEFNLYVSTLTPVSFTKCFPFFILGYYCRQKELISENVMKNYDVIYCIVGLLIGVITYTIARQRTGIVIYGFFFWIMCLSSIIGILSLCKLMDGIKSKIIENISIGTIVIMGLHWMFIGTTNFIISKVFHSYGYISYPLPLVITFTILFVALEYPIIILFRNKYSFLLGKRQISKHSY